MPKRRVARKGLLVFLVRGKILENENGGWKRYSSTIAER
jgi:hypothetical protein